jgi:pSer/pThr/pTyr-binding forkhead associated (FHA) protein
MGKENSTKSNLKGIGDNHSGVLIAEQGPLEGQRWNLANELTIGRAEDCDIQIIDRQVSRYHARVGYEEREVVLEDLGSKNGTYIEGEPIGEKIILSDGTSFQVAMLQKFVYYVSDATMPLEDVPYLAEKKKKQGLILEKKSRQVWVGNKEVLPPLSVPQFKLLELLYEQPGRVVTREELIATIWENEQSDGVSDQALDALIRRLRDRLAKHDPDFDYIVTVRGHGLRLQNRE